VRQREALAQMRFHWGDVYVFAIVMGRYTATAKFSTHNVLTADDPEQLLDKIRQHYPGPSERSST
jgi:hypothetical protein